MLFVAVDVVLYLLLMHNIRQTSTQLSFTFVAVTILFKSSLFAALSVRLKSILLRKTG